MRSPKLDQADRDTLLLALAVALCAFVLVVAVAASVLGGPLAAAIALSWLAVLLAVCFALCVRRLRGAARPRRRRPEVAR